MSDIGIEVELDPAYEDESSVRSCYVFRPLSTSESTNESVPKKRRKTKHSVNEPIFPFPLLNHGAEPVELAQLRYDTYQKVWAQYQARIVKIVGTTDAEVYTNITNFVQSAGQRGRETSKRLKTALVVSDQDGSVQTRLLEQWGGLEAENDAAVITIQLRASQCVNLQTTLRNIIKHAISSRFGQQGYQDFLNKHKRLIPMNFDLELLMEFVKEQNISRIVLSILDVETFEIYILADLISNLSSWSETIPFVLMMGIATTVSLFESRLPKSAIQLLDATTFVLQSSSKVLEQILDEVRNNSDQVVKFGSSAIASLEELTQYQTTTITSFTNAIKYCIMSHFFANSLSVLLSSASTSLPLDKPLCIAIRNTSSFQAYIEALQQAKKSSSDSQRIIRLLNDDSFVLETALSAIHSPPKSVSPKLPPFTLTECTTINSRQLLHPFLPRSRHVIERALSRPSDYLGCECCMSQMSDSSVSSSAPSSTILYTLLQEAGTVINVRDLYDAFCARASPTNGEDLDNAKEEHDGDRDDRGRMAIFYKAMAELKMLGLVKSSTSTIAKKKAVAGSGGDVGVFGVGRGRDRYGDIDFIAKTGWAGL